MMNPRRLIFGELLYTFFCSFMKKIINTISVAMSKTSPAAMLNFIITSPLTENMIPDSVKSFIIFDEYFFILKFVAK